MKRKKRIVKDGADAGLSHRAQFTICPHCDHDTKGSDDPWNDSAHTVVLRPRMYKAGCVSIISDCPKCFEPSWVHHRMTSFSFGSDWPETWKSAVHQEMLRQKLEAVREWPKGICWKCKHLRSATIEFHSWRDCVIGSGPSLTQCNRFENL